jgi:hypothetical protein
MKSVFQQFAQPQENVPGWLAGALMARKNRARSELLLPRLTARKPR